MTPATHALANKISQRIGLGYEELPIVTAIIEEGIEGLVGAEIEPETNAELRQQYEDITESHA